MTTQPNDMDNEMMDDRDIPGTRSQAGDRLEEIKKKNDNVCPTPQTVGDWKDEKWLIAAVERLQEECNKLHVYIQGRWMEGDAVKNLIKLEAENAELKRNQTEVWAVQDLLAQADKRYSELMEIKNKFAKQLATSEKARWEVEKRVDQLREQSRQVSIINKNIKSLRLHHPDPDRTDYGEHISGNCSCGVKR